MTAAQPVNPWGHVEIQAPTALGLGVPARRLAPTEATAAPATPPVARAVAPSAAAPAPAADPHAVRLPLDASDHEGMYRGLRWAIRALDECGRAFTRVASRVGKVESRIDSVEHTLAGLEARLCTVEQARSASATPARAPSPPTNPALASAPIVPLRIEAQLSSLRKDLAAATLRVARLETAASAAPPQAAPASPPAESGPPTLALAARLGALEADLQGLYRELDNVAELVAARFEAFDHRLTGVAGGGFARTPIEPAPAAPPASEVSTASDVRAKAASVLIGELERISHALGVLSDPASGPR